MTSPNLRQTLIATAAHFYQQGWMVGTSGNLSVRDRNSSVWITASGRHKGQLKESDFVRIGLDGTLLEQPDESRPSAETSIHLTIYHLFPEAQACYHIHSIEANLVARFVTSENLPLPSLEMLKGLEIWEENPKVEIPIFVNHLEINRIATEIRDRLHASPPLVPALLIRDHGVTVWGHSAASASNYIEIIQYIFRYIVETRKANIN